MIRNGKLALTLMTLFFLGCAPMIPPYERPQAPTPAHWPSSASLKGIGKGEAASANDLKWRAFFKDGRMIKVIELALLNNRDLRAAALNVERVRALYHIQGAELLPKVNGVGTSYKGRIPGDLSQSGKAMTVEEHSLNVGITAWEIDFFGRIRSLKKRALEEYLATEEARASAQMMLISEVAGACLELAGDRETFDLVQSTLKAQQASYGLIKRRFEAGLSTQLDLRQAQTRVDAARLDIARLSQKIAQDKNALNLLAGGPVPQAMLPNSLGDVAPFSGVSPGAPSETLLNRPDIRQAENFLKAANANIGAARAALFPNISLTTSFGTASNELSGLFDSGSGAWAFSPRISIPIFDPRSWSALKVTKVDQEIALVRYEKAIQGAFREVADALAGFEPLKDQESAQKSLIEASEEILRLAVARYETGTGIYLNVLDAERTLYAARQGLIAIRLAGLLNQVRLYAVLGGGAH